MNRSIAKSLWRWTGQEILMTMQDKTRKVLVKYFPKVEGGGEAMNSDMEEYFMDVHRNSLFCRLMFWGQ